MRKINLLAVLVVLVMVSCTSKAKQEAVDSQTIQKDSTASTKGSVTKSTDVNKGQTEMYACPMHPEVQGKKGVKCSKCGMELTEPVSKN